MVADERKKQKEDNIPSLYITTLKDFETPPSSNSRKRKRDYVIGMDNLAGKSGQTPTPSPEEYELRAARRIKRQQSPRRRKKSVALSDPASPSPVGMPESLQSVMSLIDKQMIPEIQALSQKNKKNYEAMQKIYANRSSAG